MNLFDMGGFVLHSGQSSYWRMNCENLSDDDWHCIAVQLRNMIPLPWGKVLGIPRGGLKLAEKLGEFNMQGVPRILIVDDVMATGTSFRDYINEHKHTFKGSEIIRAVAFSRMRYNSGNNYIYSLWQYMGD